MELQSRPQPLFSAALLVVAAPLDCPTTMYGEQLVRIVMKHLAIQDEDLIYKGADRAELMRTWTFPGGMLSLTETAILFQNCTISQTRTDRSNCIGGISASFIEDILVLLNSAAYQSNASESAGGCFLISVDDASSWKATLSRKVLQEIVDAVDVGLTCNIVESFEEVVHSPTTHDSLVISGVTSGVFSGDLGLRTSLELLTQEDYHSNSSPWFSVSTENGYIRTTVSTRSIILKNIVGISHLFLLESHDLGQANTHLISPNSTDLIIVDVLLDDVVTADMDESLPKHLEFTTAQKMFKLNDMARRFSLKLLHFAHPSPRQPSMPEHDSRPVSSTLPDLPSSPLVLTGKEFRFERELQSVRYYIQAKKPERAVLLFNFERLREQRIRWRQQLPFVEPHYAVKCNSDQQLLRALMDLDVGFDCASKTEIDLICRTLHLPSNKIIYSNPCKQEEGLSCALQQGVRLTVFDNVDELMKIAAVCPRIDLLLRIKTDDAGSRCPLSCKFGAARIWWRPLLKTAKALHLRVRGVHFHVGSGCSVRGAFCRAIRDARDVFDLAEAHGFLMDTLNLGGGFPGDLIADSSDDHSNSVSFEDLCMEINESIQTYFPSSADGRRSYRFMAEPGRFFASSCCSLGVKVFARRLAVPGDLATSMVYYVNESLYGCFNNVIFDHATPQVRVITKDATVLCSDNSGTSTVLYCEDDAADGSQTSPATTLMKSVVFGQTCDGLDCILPQVQLPTLQVGDWLFFSEMGAYTICAASFFNGFSPPEAVYVWLKDSSHEEADISSVTKPQRKRKQFSPTLSAYQKYTCEQQSKNHAMASVTLVRKPGSIRGTGSLSLKNPRPGGGGSGILSTSSGGMSIATDGNVWYTESELGQMLAVDPQKPASGRHTTQLRPVALRPLQSQTVNSRLRTKSNPRLLASLLRIAYSHRHHIRGVTSAAASSTGSSGVDCNAENPALVL